MLSGEREKYISGFSFTISISSIIREYFTDFLADTNSFIELNPSVLYNILISSILSSYSYGIKLYLRFFNISY